MALKPIVMTVVCSKENHVPKNLGREQSYQQALTISKYNMNKLNLTSSNKAPNLLPGGKMSFRRVWSQALAFNWMRIATKFASNLLIVPIQYHQDQFGSSAIFCNRLSPVIKNQPYWAQRKIKYCYIDAFFEDPYPLVWIEILKPPNKR